MTVEYRRMDGRGRKKSPERRCKAPSRDEVVPGHLRAEHRNRSGPSARRPSPSGPPPTRRGTDHFTRGARLALSPGTSVGSWAAVVADGSLRAPPQPLARHSRRGTRPGKLTSEACLTVKYRRTDGRRQKRSPEPRCKTPPRDEVVSGNTPALSAEIASGPSGPSGHPSLRPCPPPTRRGIDHSARGGASHHPQAPASQPRQLCRGRINPAVAQQSSSQSTYPQFMSLPPRAPPSFSAAFSVRFLREALSPYGKIFT